MTNSLKEARRIFSRHLVFPIHEALVRRPTFPYLKELEDTQWFSRDEIEKYQMDKLRDLLLLAKEHCPWHKKRIQEAGLMIDRKSVITHSDLEKLPLMAKEDAQQHRENMAWKKVPGGAYLYNTGGSSGKPLIFYYGRRRQASDTAGRFRAHRWWGVEVGDPEVWLWGAPVELNKTDHIKAVRDRFLNQLFLNAFEMTPEKMDNYIQAICSFKPVCIYGYATSLALLAARARAKKVDMKLPELKVIFSTGEPTYPHQREILEDVFGVPVASEFGSRDIGFTAHESPAGQMLLLSESHILEVLDQQGKAVGPGQIGEAVITGLCSQAQPFIRYKTGDMVKYTEETCRQGRGLHVLGQVAGRSTDFVVTPDGRMMHALAVIYVLRATEGVGEFKFIQHKIDDVEIQIVPNQKWDDNAETKIIAGLHARMGDSVRINIKLVDRIPAEASGKHRYVVSHVSLPAELSVTE